MNRDQVAGRVEAAKGKVKEVVGNAVGNTKLEKEGKIENTVGKIQSAYGDAVKTIKDDIENS